MHHVIHPYIRLLMSWSLAWSIFMKIATLLAVVTRCAWQRFFLKIKTTNLYTKSKKQNQCMAWMEGMHGVMGSWGAKKIIPGYDKQCKENYTANKINK